MINCKAQDYFKGQAIFETKQEAKSHMKIYELKIQTRNDSTMSNNPDKKINIQLKIFAENNRV